MSDDVKQRLRRRERAAAETLMNDSNLREFLVDEQAAVLLDWGYDRLAERVQKTAELDDEAAAEQLAKFTERIKTVMLLVNELVESFTQATEKHATLLYQTFLEALQFVQPVPIPVMHQLLEAVQARERLGKDGTFQHIMGILNINKGPRI